MSKKRVAHIEPVRIVFRLRCGLCNMELATPEDPDKEEFEGPDAPKGHFFLECDSCGTENTVPRSKIQMIHRRAGIAGVPLDKE